VYYFSGTLSRWTTQPAHNTWKKREALPLWLRQ
jgi:hypothetical protein